MQITKKELRRKMYIFIEQWKENGISPQRFCAENKLTVASFNYWLKDYIKRKGSLVNETNAFIPVEISNTETPASEDSNRIEIKYPNGVFISLPEDVSIDKLKPLLNI